LPRRKPESVKEIRYEYSLGPAEKKVLQEVQDTIKTVRTTATVASVVAPVGLACLGYGVYKAGVWVGAGLANFGNGVKDWVDDFTPAGQVASQWEAGADQQISWKDFTLIGSISRWWHGAQKAKREAEAEHGVKYWF
jgi:hypothetical protein